ncbi:RebB family R body protein [Microcoleus sp. FACHB-53]|nr:RebB family R body protein [Microcoleus sp. FACHB-53]
MAIVVDSGKTRSLIKDAINQTNVKVATESPAMTLSNLYQTKS